jgi:hypothetical protein
LRENGTGSKVERRFMMEHRRHVWDFQISCRVSQRLGDWKIVHQRLSRWAKSGTAQITFSPL